MDYINRTKLNESVEDYLADVLAGEAAAPLNIDYISPEKDSGTIQFNGVIYNFKKNSNGTFDVSSSEYDDNVDDYFSSIESIYTEDDYDSSEWEPEEIELHQSIDWAARNYDEYDTEKKITSTVYYYDMDSKDQKDDVEMHLFIRSNPIFPPYYKAVSNPFGKGLGPMADGDFEGKYSIHNRYESTALYNILST